MTSRLKQSATNAFTKHLWASIAETLRAHFLNHHMGYQLIMKRDLEPDLPEPDITRGTVEGNIKPGEITFYRLQSTADTKLKAYIAQGDILDADCESFGSIGIFAIDEMERFYRHVLIQKHFPHHGAVAFGHYGKSLFEVFRTISLHLFHIRQKIRLKTDKQSSFR